jgi:hypothetical protein
VWSLNVRPPLIVEKWIWTEAAPPRTERRQRGGRRETKHS